MRTTTLPIAFFALLLAGPGVYAADPEDPVHPTTMAGLPQSVRVLLERHHGEMADVGGPFSEGCVRGSGSFAARLLWAEVQPDTVQVRFERGGFAGAQPHQVTFRKTGDTWSEVGWTEQPERISWTGRPRAFSSPTDHILPPLWKPAGQ